MRKPALIALVAGAALAAMAVSGASAQSARQTIRKNAYGQPDLTGTWSNASLTPLERDAQYGERLVLSADEVRQLEGDRQVARAQGDAPTDPSLRTEDLPFDCGGGFTGVNCGYNSGWTDSGDLLMRVRGEARTSFITSPANGRVPPRKAGAPAPATGARPAPAAAGARFNRADNPETMTLAERCLTSFGNSAGPVMLPLLYNNNYHIQQGKDSVAIWVEMVHDVRVIRLNSQHRTDGVRPWWGDSIGWYEGDTLVVETTNYHPRNAFRGVYEDLKVTERFTRVANDGLLYEFKVEAPSMWDQPWGGEYQFSPSNGIYEYACHEGNYALEGMLAGARHEDEEAAQAANAPAN